MSDVEELRAEIAELRQRVEKLESEHESETVEGRSDSRDGNVLAALDGREGDAFHVRALMDFYREHTDIRRKDTLKRRVKDLVKSDVFERESGSRHRFVGGGDE